ncbi:HAD family hydrolase [Streptomonospora nanhaiensis]|uniref:2-haloacid dehalogenase n=1 Tax=Streptomonospora nanhaiensis TaxID=1323731 RepID=A0A853BQD4_9ACTN|nr:HAD family hydrolase [Streptomonospora nanhaiensis]MBV2366804.1 HAD hydrolase-like protein [Streptomonospora nanhaiensis]MBX9387706.1 HAD hydrolase-like protein [Streptomonospora nanhaiensis]NYI96866.1 2-haloacid dehalogenase [Streptomonospora nanhaiensis]
MADGPTAPALGGVLFDVVETLMDVRPLRQRFIDIGQPPELMQPWFLRAQRDAFALALSGRPTPFPDAMRHAMRVETRGAVTDEEIDHVVSGFGDMPAHPDAEPAIRRFAEAGVPMGFLTVGGRDATERFLERTGWDRYISRVVTAADEGVWKPAPALYHIAAESLGVPAARTALVAVHAWDCHGAKQAGLLAGWCGRLESVYGDVFTPADAVGDDLVAVAEGLLRLGR